MEKLLISKSMIGQQAVMAVMTWYVQTGSVNAHPGCNQKHGMFISSLGIQTLSQVPTFLSTLTEYYWYTAHWVKCQLHTCSWHVCMYNTESDYFMFILYINFACVALVIQIAYSNHAMPPPPKLWSRHFDVATGSTQTMSSYHSLNFASREHWDRQLKL